MKPAWYPRPAKLGNCPKCGWRMWYNAKNRTSKCARCGYRYSHGYI